MTAEVYQTINGAESNMITAATGISTGYNTFQFEVTQGIHAVKVYHNKGLPTVVSRSVNLAIPAGQQKNAILELWTAAAVDQ